MIEVRTTELDPNVFNIPEGYTVVYRWVQVPVLTDREYLVSVINHKAECGISFRVKSEDFSDETLVEKLNEGVELLSTDEGRALHGVDVLSYTPRRNRTAAQLEAIANFRRSIGTQSLSSYMESNR